MARWRSPFRQHQPSNKNINSKKRIELIYGDLRDTISINNVFKDHNYDYIFHLAAQSYPKTSFASSLDTFDTNIQGTLRVLEASLNNNPNCIIHVCSSSEVFGRVKKEDLPITEDCLFHPASPYAISKVGTDSIGRFYAEAYGLKVMTTRMFTHTGPRRGDVFAESTFAKQIALAEEGFIEPVIKVGNLDSLRTISDVRDAVKAYYMLVTINPIPGEYYNIGGNVTLKVGEILDFLINLSKIKDQLKIEVDPERIRPIDADLQVPSVEKFTKHTGWKAEIDFDKTMNDLLDYWRGRVSNEGGA